jgi:hypothetical protein
VLLKQATLAGVVDGSITVAFRRWKKPTVKTGGTLLTSLGQLSIVSVDVVEIEGLTAEDAAYAGVADLATLVARLSRRAQGDVYRVRLSFMGPDPRIALRGDVPVGAQAEEIREKLRRMDARSARGVWTRAVLSTIRDRPGQRAGDLADALGVDKAAFKTDVRKLKALGLTESLKIGYRLSPRGAAILEML